MPSCKVTTFHNYKIRYYCVTFRSTQLLDFVHRVEFKNTASWEVLAEGGTCGAFAILVAPDYKFVNNLKTNSASAILQMLFTTFYVTNTIRFLLSMDLQSIKDFFCFLYILAKACL